jgi:exonuclease III
MYQEKVNSKTDLNILNLNIQGLRSPDKYTIFSTFVETLEITPDIIILSEHWMDYDQVQLFFLKGFELIAYIARKTRQRGGVLILKNILPKAQIKNIAVTPVEYFFEGCGAQLIINNMKLILLAIYRPSNEDSNAEIPLFLERLQSVLEEIRLKRVIDSLQAGDFNIDLLEHSYHANHLTI